MLVTARVGSRGTNVSPVVGDDRENGVFENLVHAKHLLAAALHVLGVHLIGNGETLFGGDWGEPLRFEHLDARFLVAQV